MNGDRTRTPRGARSVLLLAAAVCAVPVAAQQPPDTTRVSYRARDVIFVTSGRAERLAVGDTLVVVAAGGAAVPAVVISVAQHTASARLLAEAVFPDSAVATWIPRPETLGAAAAAPAADTVPPAAVPPAAVPPAPPPRPLPRVYAPPRLVGVFQVEQLGSAGGAGRLSTSQTVGLASVRAALTPGLELRLRTTSRYRGGNSASFSGGAGGETTVYQAELAVGGRDSRWQASFGRFVPAAAMALGYLDGVRLEWRPSPGQSIGAVAGFVPDPARLKASTATRRVGAYWRFGQAGPLSGSLATAADWAGGARRRTQLATQGLWAVARGTSLSWYADADLGAPWDTAGGKLTNVFASLRVALPAGFRSSVGVERHEAVRLWGSFITGDTMPLPGRLTGVSASLGRDVGGVIVDVSGARLSRAGDPTATLRGTVTASRRFVFATASWQHGDLLDYGSFMARATLRRRLPFTASLGVLAATTRPSGGTGVWRYSLRPELAGSLLRSWMWSAGGDIGRYAGATTTWLHAGVSYRFER